MATRRAPSCGLTPQDAGGWPESLSVRHIGNQEDATRKISFKSRRYDRARDVGGGKRGDKGTDLVGRQSGQRSSQKLGVIEIQGRGNRGSNRDGTRDSRGEKRDSRGEKRGSRGGKIHGRRGGVVKGRSRSIGTRRTRVSSLIRHDAGTEVVGHGGGELVKLSRPEEGEQESARTKCQKANKRAKLKQN